MILKLFLSAALFLTTIHSEAALRCEAAHRSPAIGSRAYIAERLDAWDELHNGVLLKGSLVEALRADHSNLPFFQRRKARSNTKKLAKIMDEMKDSKDWNDHETAVFAYNLAHKLNKLALLADPTVLNAMSSVTDRNAYRQFQHSTWVHGIKDFLFDGKPVPLSFQRKVWNAFSVPFRAKYARWYFAMIVMPKLRGALIPPDLCLNVAWNGFEANRKALQPYMAHSNFKAFFNVFSSMYRWTVLTALFVGLPTYGFNTYSEARDHSRQMFKPVVEEIAKMGKIDFEQVAADKDLFYFIEEFKLNMGRAPTEVEIQFMKGMLAEQRLANQEETAFDRDGKTLLPVESFEAAEAPRGPDLLSEMESVNWVQAGSNAVESVEAPPATRHQEQVAIPVASQQAEPRPQSQEKQPEINPSNVEWVQANPQAQPQIHENMDWVPADPQAQPQVHKTVADPESKKCSIGAGSTGQQCSP